MPRRPLRTAIGRALLVFAAWTALGLLAGVQTQLQLDLGGESRAPRSVFGPALAGVWLWAAFTPVAAAATRILRPRRERGTAAGWATWLAGHALVMAALTLFGMALYVAARPLIDGTVVRFSTVVSYGLVADVTSYAVVVVVAEAAHFAALYRERDRVAAALAEQAATLRGQLGQARLEALQTQLRPHFLYNTLNVIAELVHDDPSAADRMITQLGALLRRAYRTSAQLVALDEELRFVLSYVDILMCRYAGRVTLAVNVSEAARGVSVPTFALQPLVENAFRHGVERREGGTLLAIEASVERGTLTVTVSDRQRDAREGEAARLDPDAGTGLHNTRARLATIYGDAAGLVLEHEDHGGVRARLWLPARHLEHELRAGDSADEGVDGSSNAPAGDASGVGAAGPASYGAGAYTVGASPRV